MRAVDWLAVGLAVAPLTALVVFGGPSIERLLWREDDRGGS